MQPGIFTYAVSSVFTYNLYNGTSRDRNFFSVADRFYFIKMLEVRDARTESFPAKTGYVVFMFRSRQVSQYMCFNG